MKKLPISVDKLKEGMATALPIYITNDQGESHILYKPLTIINKNVVKSLKRHKIPHVTILYKSIPQEDSIVSNDDYDTEADVAAIKHMKSFGIVTKCALSQRLKDEAIQSIRGLFDIARDEGKGAITAHQSVKQLDDIVSQLVETVGGDTGGLTHISQLKSYDEYTFLHSLSVTVLSIAIGRQLKLHEVVLKRLGRAAILHDIGKMLIPLDILNKPGKLTNEEFAIMKSHSEKGADYLREVGIEDDLLYKAVRGHHEKVDGSGYPDGLKKDDISAFAKIISVGDVYDALTSHRPYRNPMIPADVLEIIMSDVDRAFDYKIAKAFMDSVEFYPVGTNVRLSNGEWGVVVDNTHLRRPTLKMAHDGRVIDLAALDYCHLVINAVTEQSAS